MNKKQKLMQKINVEELKNEVLTLLRNQEKSGIEPSISVKKFEANLMTEKNLSKRWEIFGNNFVL